MFERSKMNSPKEYFTKLNTRTKKCVFFARINGYCQEIDELIRDYYTEARKNGVVLEEKLPNPEEKQLHYFESVCGMQFELSKAFLEGRLTKWLERMKATQRTELAQAMFEVLMGMQKEGKNDNILKNAYIKFMCWLYYKFERISDKFGMEDIPKVLYEGYVSKYELQFLSILSKVGCDILLLQYEKDAGYQKVDPDNIFSEEILLPNMQDFPKEYSLKALRNQVQEQVNQARLYGDAPRYLPCTNAWIKGKGFEDFLTNFPDRGSDDRFFYNCFYRFKGVNDKLTYINDLYQFSTSIKNMGREIVVVEGEIKKPTPDEIAVIKRKNYDSIDGLIQDLMANLKYITEQDLQKIAIKAFVDVVLEESRIEQSNLNKLLNKAVYLLCWERRYHKQLFSGYKFPKIGCFVYLGGCKNQSEVLFLKFLSKLPVDVCILQPDLNNPCCLEDNTLYEITDVNSMRVDRFPSDNGEIHAGTTAYQAERELDELMYQDTGIYRNRQYQKANTVTLRTMYEEISILWNQELKYRQNFATTDDSVTLPVIFAKVSGVKDKDTAQYFQSIRALLTEETYIVDHPPLRRAIDPNKMKAYATEFFKNRRLQRSKIKSCPDYQYSFLREEMQEYIFDKIQLLIDLQLIRGTYQNGTEYTIVSTILDLPKEIVRMIQGFDFTKKNPKLVYIDTNEEMITLEDAIVLAFLNLIGFDIVMFLPTGYMTVEKFYTKQIFEEHQIGEYIYDLSIPELKSVKAVSNKVSWVDKLFHRN